MVWQSGCDQRGADLSQERSKDNEAEEDIIDQYESAQEPWSCMEQMPK